MTTDPPLFSIITVTKDNLHGLLATRKSIEAQSCRDYEWIAVDGDSQDGTKNHLPANAISEPDGGIYDAMNKGIERARGEYLLFLNAGDSLADMDILASLAKAAQEKPDFIYGDALEAGFYKKARSHEKINWGMFTHHQAMLYRRGATGDLRYDLQYRIAADYDFTARFLKNVRNVHYIPAAICIFEEGGLSQRQRATGRGEQFKSRAKICVPWKNGLIYVGQSASALLREKAPGVYYRLKSRSSR